MFGCDFRNLVLLPTLLRTYVGTVTVRLISYSKHSICIMYMYISRSGNGIYRAGHTTRELEHGQKTREGQGQYLGRGITIVYSTELKSKAA